MNREINEAAQNCPNAQIAYNNYHNQISSVIRGFTQGKALLIDIHGQVKNRLTFLPLNLYYPNKMVIFFQTTIIEYLQAHQQNSTELGYGIDKTAFDSVVASPTHTFPSGSLSQCTINALRARLAAAGLANDYDILVGKKSMGTFLENQGFAALPGPTRPVPGQQKRKC